MPHRVIYRDLANHLATLPLSATCADLAARLRGYKGADAEYLAQLVAAVETWPGETDYLVGMESMCDEVLKRDNPRFLTLLFMDWVLEER